MKKEKEISVKEIKKIVRRTTEDIYQEVLDNCVNKQLEPYGLTIKDVRGKGAYIKKFKLKLNSTLFGFIKYPTFFEKIPWYQYYTFKSEAQFEDWKTFCILEFMSKLKLTKQMAEREFNHLNLFCGLKQEYGNQG